MVRLRDMLIKKKKKKKKQKKRKKHYNYPSNQTLEMVSTQKNQLKTLYN